MQIPIGVQVSLDNITWYKLSDHNRQPIGMSYDEISNSKRMANGTMRKYVIANKIKASTDWQNFPTLSSNLVDYNTGAHGGAWIKAFYEGNVFNPIYVKLVYATDVSVLNALPAGTYTDSLGTTGKVFNAFITSFTYDIIKRRVAATGAGYDYVNIKIEFTEI